MTSTYVANEKQPPPSALPARARRRIAVARARTIAARIMTSLLGLFCILYGAIAAISPLPAGLPLMIFGILLISLANPRARPFVKRLRRRCSWFDRLVRIVGGRSPRRMKALLDETDPTRR